MDLQDLGTCGLQPYVDLTGTRETFVQSRGQARSGPLQPEFTRQNCMVCGRREEEREVKRHDRVDRSQLQSAHSSRDPL